MERCVSCLNDTTVRNFSLDGDGVCNFCREYSKIEDKLNDDARMQKLFLDRIERVRGKHAYDAAAQTNLYPLSSALLSVKFKLPLAVFAVELTSLDA